MARRKKQSHVKIAESKEDYSSLKKDKAYTEAKEFIPVEEKPHWFRRSKRKEWEKNQELLKKKEKVVLIKIELNNGNFKEFLIEEDDGAFIFNKNKYVFDLEQKYYIVGRDIWAYDYHESLSLPIRKKVVITEGVSKFLAKIEDQSKKPMKPQIEANEIKKLVENSDLIDVEASLNPTTLKRFTDSEVIKQVLQGAMLGRIFKIMFILIIIIAIFQFLSLIIDMYQSGLFEKISNALHKD